MAENAQLSSVRPKFTLSLGDFSNEICISEATIQTMKNNPAEDSGSNDLNPGKDMPSPRCNSSHGRADGAADPTSTSKQTECVKLGAVRDVEKGGAGDMGTRSISGAAWKIWRDMGTPNRAARAALMALAIAAFLAILWDQNGPDSKEIPEKTYSDFVKDAEASRLKVLSLSTGFLNEQAKVELKDGTEYKVTMPHLDLDASAKLAKLGAEIKFEKPRPDYSRHLSTVVLMIVLMFLVITMAPSLKDMRMGRGRAKSTTKFADVAGAEEAKRALQDAVEYLENPQKFEALGARFPKGILLSGEPGTGKTLLAKAVAGEAKANFIAVSGTDFGSMFVSGSATKIRRIFAAARKSAPCVLFIDEIDAVGGRRMSEGTSVAREMGNTLNQMLVEMDGFDSVPGVLIIGATNRPESLDPALLRSGRFDRRIHMPSPNLAEREAVLRVHTAKVKIARDFDHAQMARASIGMSPADLANLVNQAAMLAAKSGAVSITTEHALKARDILLIGEARTSASRGFDDHTRRVLAAHESGHAVVALLLGPDPVTCISIIPRGPSLGATFMTPTQERLVLDERHLKGQIAVLLGGRAAEQLMFGMGTTGARDDLARATQCAKEMICSHGMGKIGLQTLSEQTSAPMQFKIESEIGHVLEQSMETVMATLNGNRGLFDELMHRLLDDEEIHEADIHAVMAHHGLAPRHARSSYDRFMHDKKEKAATGSQKQDALRDEVMRG